MRVVTSPVTTKSYHFILVTTPVTTKSNHFRLVTHRRYLPLYPRFGTLRNGCQSTRGFVVVISSETDRIVRVGSYGRTGENTS